MNTNNTFWFFIAKYMKFFPPKSKVLMLNQIIIFSTFGETGSILLSVIMAIDWTDSCPTWYVTVVETQYNAFYMKTWHLVNYEAVLPQIFR